MDAVQRAGTPERMNYIKRFCCLLLTFVFCFSLMPPPRAKALVIAGTAVTAGLIVQVIAGAGATIQAADLAYKVVEDYFAANPAAEALLLEKTKIVMDAASGTYHAVCDFGDDLWQSVCDWVDSKYNPGVNSAPISYGTTTLMNSNGVYYTSVSFYDKNFVANFTFQIRPGAVDYYVNGSYRKTITGVSAGYIETSEFDAQHYNGSIYFLDSNGQNTFDVGLGNFYVTKSSLVLGGQGVIGADNYIDQVGREWFNEQYRSVSVPLYPSASADGIKIGTDYYDGYLPETYGWISGEAYVDGNGIAHDATEAKTYQDVAFKEKVSGLPLVDDGGTLTIPKADSAYDVGDITIGEIDAATKDGALSALLITKFPFSIPWDVYNAIKLLAAPAMVPHWEVDFMAPIAHRVGGWQGDTTIVIDFSEYELLGQLSRWLTTIMFMAALAMGTKKIMWTA